MDIIIFLFIGLIAGYLAGKIVDGHGFGTVGDMALGIVGAFVGGELVAPVGGLSYNLVGAIVTATLGAVLILFVANLFRVGMHSRKSKAEHI